LISKPQTYHPERLLASSQIENRSLPVGGQALEAANKKQNV
jgi:hypothetical protein